MNTLPFNRNTYLNTIHWLSGSMSTLKIIFQNSGLYDFILYDLALELAPKTCFTPPDLQADVVRERLMNSEESDISLRC